MIVGVYVRVSTDTQEDSSDVQLDLIHRYCEREGHSIVTEYIDEAVSGGLPIVDRPAASRMLADAKAHKFEAIVSKQMDRIGRNAGDSISFAGKLKKLNIQLLFVQESFADTPGGRLSFGILAVLSQYYREDIGQKIKDHALWVVQQGKHAGGNTGYGFDYDKTTKAFAPSKDASNVESVFRAYLESGGSREQTAHRLNELGILGPTGLPWEAIRVRRVIGNPAYLGRLRYDGKEYDFDLPVIVDQGLVMQARELLETTRGRRARDLPNGNHPYTMVLYCGLCGARTFCSHPGDMARGIRAQYRCRTRMRQGRVVCNSGGIAESRLDMMVVPVIGELLRSHKLELAERVEKESPKPLQKQSTKKLQEERTRAFDAYTSGLVDRGMFEQKLSNIDERLRQAEQVAPRKNMLPADMMEMAENFEELWGKLTPQERRGLLLALTPRIVVWTGKTARVEIHTPLSEEPIQARTSIRAFYSGIYANNEDGISNRD